MSLLALANGVLGPKALTVGGLVMRTAKGDMSYSAENSSVTIAGSADLASDTKFRIQSHDTIEITALNELALAAGKATVTLTPAAIKFVGDLALKAPSKIGITGKPDNVTS